MLKFHSGYSQSVNPEKAIFESVTKIANTNNIEVDLVILHSTNGHNLQKLLSSIKKAHPNADVIGCTGSGVISNDWVNESIRAVATMVISGKDFSTSSISEVTPENSQSLSKQCAEKLKNSNQDINMLMMFTPGMLVNADGAIAGVESIFGEEVPILGGTSGFAGSNPRTPVFHGEQVLDQSIVLLGFSDTDLEVVQVAHHGYLPQKDYIFNVTKVNGNSVEELNGKPAWPTLMKSFELPTETSVIDLIPIMSLGITLNEHEAQEYDNDCILRAPLMVSEDGGKFHLSAPVEVGTQLISCQRDEEYLFNGMDKIGERYKKKLKNRKPIAIFQMDCMARGRKTTGKIEKDEIIHNLQKSVMGDSSIPWLGDYGFGEFGILNGQNRFHNYTTSISVIVQK